MPIYHHLGQIPRKRHVVFRQPSGTLYAEELIGNKGFTGPSSLLYHLRPPTRVRSIRALASPAPALATGEPPRPRHFRTGPLTTGPSATLDRRPLLVNPDVTLSFVRPQRDDDFFYRNGQADEIVYVSTGGGIFESALGALRFGAGDYLVIPRGITHRYRFHGEPASLLVIESAGYVRTPRRYRNEHGQLLESSPYSERDIRRPEDLAVHDETGAFRVVLKKDDGLADIELDHHPFDVVGWDGYYYPWAFNIRDFEPRVGRVHLPPPFHQTFEGDGFVVCSFCPRPYDFDPEAVPAPYHHSNVMSDEVIYYASAEFMSRKGVEYGSLTLHPDGFPHGPHPGRAEESIGKPGTDELAVMVDTFRPLRATRDAAEVEDAEYYRSWLSES